MDVTMPDGTVVRGVPDGTTQAQLQARYAAFTKQKGPSKAPDAAGSPLDRANAAVAKSFGNVWDQIKSDTGEALHEARVADFPKDAKEFAKGGDPIQRVLANAGLIFAPLHGLVKGAIKEGDKSGGLFKGVKLGDTGAEVATDVLMAGKAPEKPPTIEGWPERAPPGKDDTAFKAGRSLDETMHRVTTNNQADVADARQYIESLPKEHQSPQFQERVYHEIEQRMLDPKAPFSPDVQKFVEGTSFKDWYAKQKPLYDWIKAHKNGEELLDEEVSLFPAGEHNLPRVRPAKGNLDTELVSDKAYMDAWEEHLSSGARLNVAAAKVRSLGGEPDVIGIKDSDELKAAHAELAKVQKEFIATNDAWAREEIKARKNPQDNTPPVSDTSSGYVHRIAQGKGSRYDATDPGNRDVLAPGGRSLPRKAESENPRKFFVLDDGKGGRTFVAPGKGDALVPGEQHIGSDGHTYTVRYATSQEVEANTPVRYHKNAVVNTVENVLKLQRVKRALETLDTVKAEGEASGLMFTGKAASKAPRDFDYPDMPQMRDVKMHPALKAALDDFYQKTPGPLMERIDAANRFLTRSIFFNPVPHVQNVAAFWATARGSDWMRPGGYGSLVRTGAKAIREVATQGPLVKQMLRDGSALQYPRTANQNFYKLMISRMGTDIEGDPQTWADVARNFGFSTPKDLVKQIYRTSQKAMWMGSDMMMVQRVLELQEKGMALPQAIQEAERWIPNYRVPSQVWNGPGGRAVSQLLQSPSGIMFGRYKYDQVKLIANLAHDLAAGTTAQRKEALAKAVVLVGMATVAYPLADAALQKVMGRNDVRFRRAGPLSIPDALWHLDQGQKDWASALSTIVTPAPLIQATTEGLRNKDFFGRDIVDKDATPLGKGVQAGEWAAGQVAPVGEAEEAMRPGGAAKVGLRNIGVQTLPKGTPPKIERRLRRAAARREGSDAVEQALRNAFPQ